MHLITFLFVCIEIVILFYLLIYRLARPNDKTSHLNIILILLLLFYNISGGLLPDENLPGSYFMQICIAYATGFTTPSFFPYYVYRAFDLEGMKFHAQKGVFVFLVFPYLVFVLVFAATDKLDIAKNLLILPVLYASWVIITLVKSIRAKYKNSFTSRESKVESAVLLLSLTPWVGLPVIDFFNGGQAVEALITNIGFLTLLGLQVSRHIKAFRVEHERLQQSERKLMNWNKELKSEVSKRTSELELINEQRTNTFINLAHETKTPITLINNYLEEYLSSHENTEELSIVKRNINKLTNDITNLFDLEKFNKGFLLYNHNKTSQLSDLLTDAVAVFASLAKKKNILLVHDIESDILIQADPMAINRIINNLFDNAVKYSPENTKITIILNANENKVTFSIKDEGEGIPKHLQQKIFEPYYQITRPKSNSQGMGLGLPIVSKVVADINGKIIVISDPPIKTGTEITLALNRYYPQNYEQVSSESFTFSFTNGNSATLIEPLSFQIDKPTILLVEDNTIMLNYLIKKLQPFYNIIPCNNGADGIDRLKNSEQLPSLIISDVMMDRMDGYEMAKIIAQVPGCSHIPIIFLTAKNTSTDRLQGLKLGAVDYIAKPFHIGELLQKVESIICITEKQQKATIERLLQNASRSVQPQPEIEREAVFEQNCQRFKLSAREVEITGLIGLGLTYKAIADRLFLSEKTVNKHAQNIFEKVQVGSKLELMRKLASTVL